MTRIDQIIADALAGSPETHVAILAREVVRLREAPAVVVPDVNEIAQEIRRIDGKHDKGAGVIAEELRDWLLRHLCIIPADRALGEGVVALRRFAERCAQRDHQPDEHIGRAKCVACEAEDALRANQGTGMVAVDSLLYTALINLEKAVVREWGLCCTGDRLWNGQKAIADRRDALRTHQEGVNHD